MHDISEAAFVQHLNLCPSRFMEHKPTGYPIMLHATPCMLLQSRSCDSIFILNEGQTTQGNKDLIIGSKFSYTMEKCDREVQPNNAPKQQ